MRLTPAIGAAVLAAGLALTSTGARAEVQAELLTDVTAIRPGDGFTAAIRLTLKDAWHTYWTNPGDVGIPARFRWTLPPGCLPGEAQWPPPERFVDGDLVSFGYEGVLTLLVPIQTTTNMAPAAMMRLAVDVALLLCKEECIPFDVSASGVVGIGAETQAARETVMETFEAARRALPVHEAQWRFASMRDEQDVLLFVDPPLTVDVATLRRARWFPAKRGQLDLREAGQWTTVDGMTALRVRAARGGHAPGDPLDGLLVWSDLLPAGYRAVHVHAPPP